LTSHYGPANPNEARRRIGTKSSDVLCKRKKNQDLVEAIDAWLVTSIRDGGITRRDDIARGLKKIRFCGPARPGLSDGPGPGHAAP
jgi:hypothetical protein